MPPGVRPQVLNDAFQAAANEARQKLPNLTANQEVCQPQQQNKTSLSLCWYSLVSQQCLSTYRLLVCTVMRSRRLRVGRWIGMWSMPRPPSCGPSLTNPVVVRRPRLVVCCKRDRMNCTITPIPIRTATPTCRAGPSLCETHPSPCRSASPTETYPPMPPPTPSTPT